MFCSNCGAQIDDKACICVHCGTSVGNTKKTDNDKGGFWWGFLGFIFPVVGLIVWLVTRESTPKNARSCGIGAIAGVITEVVLSILFVILYIAVIAAIVGSATMV